MKGNADTVARKREAIEEARARIERYAFKIRSERWAIATLERQIQELEAVTPAELLTGIS